MSEFKSSSFRNEDNSGAPDIVGVTTFTSPFYFVPPSGTTAQRPSGDGLAPGMLRFNTDIGRLEVWRGDHWGIILGESPNLGISTAAAPASSGTGARGVFGGGDNPADQSRLDFITISSLGNSIQFGNLTDARTALSACSSSTRAVFCGGYSATETITDFVTFSSGGSATSFGNLTLSGTKRIFTSSLSSSTRGITIGGTTQLSAPATLTNVIDYITIAFEGNSQDFGDLTSARYAGASFASSTRGVFGGGYEVVGSNRTNTIDYVTISTLGNSIRFGNLTNGYTNQGGCSNATRGLFVGGFTTTPGPISTSNNTIEFTTIASTGNTQDFGDLTAARTSVRSCSSPTRAVIIGGNEASRVNTIEYVNITTTGNSLDFGDMNTASPASAQAACSNAHGGL